MNALTIFYTDDDEDDLSLFSEAVKTVQKDYKLHTFDRPEKFLTAINNPPPTPQVIFLDLNMPGKNGLELLEELRGSETHKNTPVIIFTTTSDVYTINQCKASGANYFITKPLSMKGLITSLEHTLKIDWKNFFPTINEFAYRPS